MDDDKFLDEELESLKSTPTVEEVTPVLNQAAERLKNNPKHEADLLKAQFIALIREAMEKEDISKSALGDRMHKSRQYIGRVLNETANFTIESMVELCSALNLTLEFSVQKSVIFPQKDCSDNAPLSPAKIERKAKSISHVA